MDKTRLISLIQNPDMTTPADTLALTNLVRKYPFFHSAQLLLLYNLKKFEKDAFDRRLRESAIFVSDRKILFNLIYGLESHNQQMSQFKATDHTKPQGKISIQDDTIELHIEESLPILIIDSIPDTESEGLNSIRTELLEIDESPRIKERSNEVSSKGKIDGSFVTSSKIEAEENINQLDIIDKFIMEDPVFKPKKNDQDVQNEDISKDSITESEDLATETLALIYISQKLFNKAITIYEKLILKFPEKKAYFASRIEELKKNIK
jgi:hypothetical protein